MGILTVGEVARYFKVNESTIIGWTRPKDRSYIPEFPVHRLMNNNRYFLASEIKEYIDGKEGSVRIQ